MSGQFVVAVLGRPLRTTYCQAYLASRSAEDTLVAVVPDYVTAENMPAGTQSIVAPIQAPLERGGLSGRVARARMIQWMRSGSTTGVRVERWLRQMRDTRRRSGAISGFEVGPTRGLWGGPWPKGVLQSLLDEVDAKSTIDVVVVFDVFALPEVMNFREGRQVEVVVR